ncbi:hypothetical protein ACWGH2_36775 [Streptomyces sp. NPDC054871]
MSSTFQDAPPAGAGAACPAGPHLMDPDLLADPFGGYGRLRERGPVVRGRFVDGTPVRQHPFPRPGAPGAGTRPAARQLAAERVAPAARHLK